MCDAGDSYTEEIVNKHCDPVCWVAEANATAASLDVKSEFSPLLNCMVTLKPSVNLVCGLQARLCAKRVRAGKVSSSVYLLVCDQVPVATLQCMYVN